MGLQPFCLYCRQRIPQAEYRRHLIEHGLDAFPCNECFCWSNDDGVDVHSNCAIREAVRYDLSTKRIGVQLAIVVCASCGYCAENNAQLTKHFDWSHRWNPCETCKLMVCGSIGLRIHSPICAGIQQIDQKPADEFHQPCQTKIPTPVPPPAIAPPPPSSINRPSSLLGPVAPIPVPPPLFICPMESPMFNNRIINVRAPPPPFYGMVGWQAIPIDIPPPPIRRPIADPMAAANANARPIDPRLASKNRILYPPLSIVNTTRMAVQWRGGGRPPYIKREADGSMMRQQQQPFVKSSPNCGDYVSVANRFRFSPILSSDDEIDEEDAPPAKQSRMQPSSEMRTTNHHQSMKRSNDDDRGDQPKSSDDRGYYPKPSPIPRDPRPPLLPTPGIPPTVVQGNYPPQLRIKIDTNRLIKSLAPSGSQPSPGYQFKKSMIIRSTTPDMSSPAVAPEGGTPPPDSTSSTVVAQNGNSKPPGSSSSSGSAGDPRVVEAKKKHSAVRRLILREDSPSPPPEAPIKRPMNTFKIPKLKPKGQESSAKIDQLSSKSVQKSPMKVQQTSIKNGQQSTSKESPFKRPSPRKPSPTSGNGKKQEATTPQRSPSAAKIQSTTRHQSPCKPKPPSTAQSQRQSPSADQRPGTSQSHQDHQHQQQRSTIKTEAKSSSSSINRRSNPTADKTQYEWVCRICSFASIYKHSIVGHLNAIHQAELDRCPEFMEQRAKTKPDDEESNTPSSGHVCGQCKCQANEIQSLKKQVIEIAKKIGKK